MQYSIFFQLAYLAGLQINAATAAQLGALTLNPANEFCRKAMPGPVLCGPTTDQQAWPLQSVQDAYNALVLNGALSNPQKPVAGTRFYPRQYGSNKGKPGDKGVADVLNTIPECNTEQKGKKFFEFPITTPVFTGGEPKSQGQDRVLAISPSPGQGIPRTFTYCLAITHRGGTGFEDSSFRPCTSL